MRELKKRHQMLRQRPYRKFRFHET
jgi:hypothetical protein